MRRSFDKSVLADVKTKYKAMVIMTAGGDVKVRNKKKKSIEQNVELRNSPTHVWTLRI